MSRSRWLFTAAAGLTLSVAFAPPVAARPLEHAHYSWADSWDDTDWECGVDVHVEAWGDGLFMLKEGREGDPTPYRFENFEYHFVVTNPETGLGFREDGSGVYKDLRITHVEGTVYTFEALQAGRAYTLSDLDGNRVLMDRGRLLTTFSVDTKGDSDLSNDTFIEGSFALLADNGRHPGWYVEDLCPWYVDLLT
jgi:hypothetical protein